MQPEQDDERPDWEEVEPEQEPPERKGGVLGGTAPLARIVFAVILIALLVTTVLALKGGLQRWFGD
jgi:hypothetical protein